MTHTWEVTTHSGMKILVTAPSANTAMAKVEEAREVERVVFGPSGRVT